MDDRLAETEALALPRAPLMRRSEQVECCSLALALELSHRVFQALLSHRVKEEANDKESEPKMVLVFCSLTIS